jgi:class 3 adenylate cyclase
MSKADGNQILISEAVFRAIAPSFQCEDLGAIALKGKTAPTPIFALQQLNVIC